MKLYTFDSKKGREVVAGTLKDNVFIKKVRPNHFFYAKRAYGISTDVLDRLLELNCKLIRIETKTLIYESNINQWFECKILNFGSGNQRFLAMHNHTIVGAK